MFLLNCDHIKYKLKVILQILYDTAPISATCLNRQVKDSRFKICIHHIHNYTEYNQQWNVSQVRSMDSAIIWNINTREYT